MNMTNKKNIWAFFDITRHNELKDKYFEATGLDVHAYVTKSSFKRFFVFKHKWHNFKKGTYIMQGLKSKNKKIWRKRGKHAKKKGKTKMIYYNCGKRGDFARECIEPKKVLSHSTLSYEIHVFNTIVWIESHPMWIA